MHHLVLPQTYGIFRWLGGCCSQKRKDHLSEQHISTGQEKCHPLVVLKNAIKCWRPHQELWRWFEFSCWLSTLNHGFRQRLAIRPLAFSAKRSITADIGSSSRSRCGRGADPAMRLIFMQLGDYSLMNAMLVSSTNNDFVITPTSTFGAYIRRKRKRSCLIFLFSQRGSQCTFPKKVTHPQFRVGSASATNIRSYIRALNAVDDSCGPSTRLARHRHKISQIRYQQFSV